MRNLAGLNHHRVKTPEVLNYFGSYGDHTCGVFEIPIPRTGAVLKVVASSGDDWDHLSVSLPNRCPNWIEMEFAKRKFFNPEEVCMQLHVAEADHLSIHPHVLHIWRPQKKKIPLPPKEFV